MAGSQTLTDYERKRLENIKRNQQMMSSFKLHGAANEFFSSTKRDGNQAKGENKIPKEKKPKLDQESIEIRRSLRARDRSDLPESKSSHRKLEPVVSMSDANIYNVDQQHLIDTVKGLSKRPTSKSRSVSKRGHGNGDPIIDLNSLVLKPENITNLMRSPIINLLFFPCNDRSLIVAGNKSGHVSFWDFDRNGNNGGEVEEDDDDDGICIYGPHTGAISGITISPFSLTKVYTSSNDGCIRLMDVEKESFNLVYSNEDSIFCISHRPHEAKSLYFGEANGVINVWDERAGKSSSLWALHDQRVNTIDFNPEDTNLMATSSMDGTACIWDLRSINANRPKPLKMVDHRQVVHSAYFSPSGSYLATTSVSGKVGLLRGVDFGDISMINHDNNFCRAIWGWDDSCLFIGSTKRGVDVIPTNYRKVWTLESPHMPAMQCRFAAHPHMVGMLAAGNGSHVYVWVSQQ